MSKLREFFSNFKRDNTQADNVVSQDNSIKIIRNWYEERYDHLLVQRNLLVLIAVILLLLSAISVGVVVYVVNAKSFDPFVIQLDSSTGAAQIVTPASSEVLTADESLARYFIKKYVIARETYNPVDFETDTQQIIRLLSSNQIFWSYRSYIKDEKTNPVLKYGQKNTTYLVAKSWSKLADKKYMFRFAINEMEGEKRVYNKIAIVEFNYVAMELADKDRDINPVGFQVKGYRVDDDNS